MFSVFCQFIPLLEAVEVTITYDHEGFPGFKYRGVRITEVKAGTSAFLAGLRLDHIITHVGGVKVSTARHVKRAFDVAKAGCRSFTIGVKDIRASKGTWGRLWGLLGGLSGPYRFLGGLLRDLSLVGLFGFFGPSWARLFYRALPTRFGRSRSAGRVLAHRPPFLFGPHPWPYDTGHLCFC